MNLNAFNIDAINKMVSINGHDHTNGISLGISGIRLHGHEGKSIQEIEKHAREQAKVALLALAASL
ncbi:hypothetical protein [Sphingomonas oligoaromativorans]|uniref:hypothetical protein n=1 Tax=Sphingomonas oligoaromativorans TaxID=575322 RepID=UPI00141EB8BA|nr:hypothetical protein [Sphingomonas oligoaromativorans]NIJ34343.1 hypothetical protein [Sphingomonas oligoaromativorans]